MDDALAYYQRVGDFLRTTREQQGIRMPDVAAALRINIRYLRALEEAKYTELPGTAYIIGYLGNYATYLGLDPQEVIEHFKRDREKFKRKTVFTPPHANEPRFWPGPWLITAGLALIAVIYGVWYGLAHAPVVELDARLRTIEPVPGRYQHFFTLTLPEQRLARSLSPSPCEQSLIPRHHLAWREACPKSPDATRLPTTKTLDRAIHTLCRAQDEFTAAYLRGAPYSPWRFGEPYATRVVVYMNAPAQLTITDLAGRTYVDAYLQRGAVVYVPNAPGVFLETGDAGALTVFADGRMLAPLGVPGQPLTGFSLDAPYLKRAYYAMDVL